jgi:DNA-binding MarR family transcriptional regulator
MESSPDVSPETAREMMMLEEIEHDPDVSQASLATQLGVAVGTVNWHLKRLIAKGYVKVKRAERRKLRYIITPEGIAFRARLTIDYIEQSMLLYRRTRQRVRELLSEVRAEGYDRVRIEGDSSAPSDIGDICRLTCLEQGMRVVADSEAPTLAVQGMKVHLKWQEEGVNERE